MTISDSTIRRNIFTDLRTKLVAGLPTVTLTAVYNDKDPSRKQIVLQPPLISEDFDKFGGSEGKKAITVVIMLYGENTKALEELTDSVAVLLKANDVSGISLVGIDEDYAFNLGSEDKFRSKTLSCSYLRE